MLLETFVILTAARIVRAQRVFEFGTYLGSTTLNLAMNLPQDGQVFTLDLGGHEAAQAAQHPLDAELTRNHLASRSKLDFIGNTASAKITTLEGDSTKFDFKRWAGSIDLVFIDGGHDFATVNSDTENALRMVRKDRLSCILWHDYGNAEYPDVTDFLDRLSQSLDLFHVEETKVCAWFGGPCGAIHKGLLPNG